MRAPRGREVVPIDQIGELWRWVGRAKGDEVKLLCCVGWEAGVTVRKVYAMPTESVSYGA